VAGSDWDRIREISSRAATLRFFSFLRKFLPGFSPHIVEDLGRGLLPKIYIRACLSCYEARCRVLCTHATRHEVLNWVQGR
jgi:hypothetical protein